MGGKLAIKSVDLVNMYIGLQNVFFVEALRNDFF